MFQRIFFHCWTGSCRFRKAHARLGARRSEIFTSYLVKLLPLDVLQRHINNFALWWRSFVTS